VWEKSSPGFATWQENMGKRAALADISGGSDLDIRLATGTI
jgi:hypothetical protein